MNLCIQFSLGLVGQVRKDYNEVNESFCDYNLFYNTK